MEEGNIVDESLCQIDQLLYNPRAKEDMPECTGQKIEWKEYSQDTSIRAFDFAPRIYIEGPTNVPSSDPIGLFNLFFDDYYWKYLEEQSNLYLEQLKNEKEEYLLAHENSRVKRWKPVTKDLLKKWFGIRLLTSLHSNNQFKSIHFLFL